MKLFLIMMTLLTMACSHQKVANNKQDFAQMADFYFQQENHSRARFYYLAAIEKGQGDKANNLSQLGVISIKLNQYEEARSFFQQSDELKRNQSTIYNLALTNLLLNLPQKSFEYLNLLSDMDEVEATKLRIIACMQVNDFSQSLTLFEKLPAKVRKNGDIHPYYVYTLIQMGKLEEADFQMINVKDLQIAKRIMKVLKLKLASK